ncbi:hypothetical protein [Motiliproteus sp. MSK22-1]|uniref:hypothetical protein n=1 Tax=Motiliproteus sp. MSK22-1 TaxID=1897630 RepID=UPI000976839A|nr:hypothetical protein [Motiliproteus sp. MSK22-1]OMH39151.1 hypothetical protein BGP75_05500 [Motiliproteus sp. MSK22-1]
MNHKKRVSMLGDERPRKGQPLLIGFSGASFATSGSVSILGLQDYLLENFSGVLEKFPEYQAFFTISTWLSFTAGVLFLLIPTTLTLWVGIHLIGVSLLYLISAAKGVADLSFWAYIIPYWAWTAAVLSQGAGDLLKFYFKHTYIDFWVLLSFKVGFLVWAVLLFNELDL